MDSGLISTGGRPSPPGLSLHVYCCGVALRLLSGSIFTTRSSRVLCLLPKTHPEPCDRRNPVSYGSSAVVTGRNGRYRGPSLGLLRASSAWGSPHQISGLASDHQPIVVTRTEVRSGAGGTGESRSQRRITNGVRPALKRDGDLVAGAFVVEGSRYRAGCLGHRYYSGSLFIWGELWLSHRSLEPVLREELPSSASVTMSYPAVIGAFDLDRTECCRGGASRLPPPAGRSGCLGARLCSTWAANSERSPRAHLQRLIAWGIRGSISVR